MTDQHRLGGLNKRNRLPTVLERKSKIRVLTDLESGKGHSLVHRGPSSRCVSIQGRVRGDLGALFSDTYPVMKPPTLMT